MSRKIKYRWWNGQQIIEHKNIFCAIKNINNPNGELMLFTGLKDENGKEIYEGDIVKSGMTGALYVIMFGGFSTKDSHGIGFWKKGINITDRGITYDNSSNSVKGNIYENPELIINE